MVSNNEFSTWGPTQKEATESGNQVIKTSRTFPTYWPVFLGMLGTVILPLLVLIPATFILVRNNPTLAQDPATLTKKVTDVLTNNVVGISSALFLTWVALFLPVFVTGRRYFNGWKNLVKWRFVWKQDLLIALGFAVSLRVIEAISSAILRGIFKVDPNKLSNGGLISSAGSKWLPLLGLLAAIGAPIAEELFFRGLTLNILLTKLSKYASGRYISVGVSSILFAMLHSQATLVATIYMVSSTFIVGCLLATLVLKTGRLGTSVLAHGAFNGSAVVMSLLGL